MWGERKVSVCVCVCVCVCVYVGEGRMSIHLRTSDNLHTISNTLSEWGWLSAMLRVVMHKHGIGTGDRRGTRSVR